MKKLTLLLLLFAAAISFSMISCNNISPISSVTDSSLFQPKHHISEYDISSIGDFHNGLARFTIKLAPENIDSKYFEDEWSRAEFIEYYTKDNRSFKLCGYCDVNGNVVILPEYNKDSPDFTEVMVRLERWIGWRLGYTIDYVNVKGKTILSFSMDDVSDSGEVANGLFWIEDYDNNLEYYDTKGKKVFEFHNARNYYDDGIDYSTFSNDDIFFDVFGKKHLAIIELNDLNTLIDNSGKVINLSIEGLKEDISPIYDTYEIEKFIGNKVEEFSFYSTEENHGAWGGSGIIDLQQNTLTITENEDLFKGTYSSKIYDESLQPVLDFNVLEGFETYKKFHWNISKDKIVSLRCDENTYAVVGLDGKVYIAPNADISLKNEFSLFTFSDGLCVCKSEFTQLYGYINLSGEWIIPPIYREARTFYEGVAVVNGSVVIDKTGNAVLIGNESDYVDLNSLPEDVSEMLNMIGIM